MRKLRIATAAAIATATLVAVAADPAAAKGPRSATIEGPGLDAPIEESAAGMSNLPTLTGLFGTLWADPTIPLLDEAPADDLGPAWVITWDMGTYADVAGVGSDSPDLVRQTVYPYADDGPIVHTEAGQPFYGEETVGGWYEAPSGLVNVLGRLGVPAESEFPGAPVAAGGDDDPEPARLAAPIRASAARSPDDSSTDWIAPAATLLAILAAATILFTRRRRTPA